MLDEDEDERVDETALRQLTEMGFPESRAAKALRLNQYVGRLLPWGLPRGGTPLPTLPGWIVSRTGVILSSPGSDQTPREACP